MNKLNLIENTDTIIFVMYKFGKILIHIQIDRPENTLKLLILCLISFFQ